MLMNAKLTLTAVMLMLLVPTPREVTTVHVRMDMLVMERTVPVRRKISSSKCTESTFFKEPLLKSELIEDKNFNLYFQM